MRSRPADVLGSICTEGFQIDDGVHFARGSYHEFRFIGNGPDLIGIEMFFYLVTNGEILVRHFDS